MVCSAIAFVFFNLHGQTDTGSMLDNTPPPVEKVQNAFKTTKVINLQSLEVTDAGVFDFKIYHRFGPLNAGPYEAYGLDQAVIRIGGEYGVLPNLMIGAGRSSVNKAVDGYIKYRIMHQTSDNKKPMSILIMGESMYMNQKFDYAASRTQRMAYTGQLIIGRKFSESFSLQLSPSFVHFNLVPAGTSNDFYALGIGLRKKLTPRTSLNLEYVPVFTKNKGYYSSISAGFDIETGGHVFQLHITNSTGMMEPQFIARNENSWQSGGIRFGFNISRVFTFVDPSRFKNNTY